MQKQARFTFEGELIERTMTAAYPAIAEVLVFPVGRLSKYNPQEDDYTNEALDNGWKQRVGDFRALDKEMSEREKDQEAFERGQKYLDHLLGGGEWKMTPERGLTADLIEAVQKIATEPYTADQLRKAAKADPKQVSKWRKNLRVRNELAKIAERKANANLKAAGDDVEELQINL